MAQDFKNAASCWKFIMSDVSQNSGLLQVIEKFARENTSPAKIVFGTSGWRGEIGSDFTFHNIRIVTASIIEMMKSNDRSVMQAMGVSDFDEIKRRGVIVGHDNRFLNPDFSMEVIGLLQIDGITTWYAGEVPTPLLSAGIEMLNAACSINLTPSHNPANYGGCKFNPSDGGPAGPEITRHIEEIANRKMKDSLVLQSVKPASVQTVDSIGLYKNFLTERKTLDLEKIENFIGSEDCIICIDNVHGSTRGVVESILSSSARIKFLRTEENFLFGGIAPEPSEKNMQGVENILKQSNARFKLGVIMDPDGDRIRYADGSVQIPMNYFGALALHFLHVHKNISGIVAKSVGTSNLVNAIAVKLKIPLKETPVGFKNFRPYMLRSSEERAIVAFEESDGISAYNHTLEKDAIFGFLLAVEMMAVTRKNLSEYLKDVMDEYGYYYPDRSGIAVDQAVAGKPLLQKLSTVKDRYRKGTAITIGRHARTVKDVITVDGTKIIFDDGSWLMIRPSGTEPKVRFYIEARTSEDKKAIFDLAERMTRDAIG
ncbi:MAG: pgm [Nitrospirae bacterium]|nr:pgm [Nitrospirota bacterium]